MELEKNIMVIYDKLLFEGEYLNGKRNGKGKEYYYSYVFSSEEEEYLTKKENIIGEKFINLHFYLKVNI